MERMIAGSALILSLVFSGCGQKDLKDITFSGTLEMTEHQLGAKAAGGIVSLSVEEGDMVKAGQVLANLDRYEQARKDHERVTLLAKDGGSSAQSVEYALLDMQDMQVISPIDGVVLVKVRQVGEVVAPGSAVVVLGDPKDQWVRIFVPEGMVNRIRPGQEAAISFDGSSKVYKGHVRTIATKAEFTPRNVQTPEERVTQNIAVKVEVDDPDLQAHPGVAADIKFKE